MATETNTSEQLKRSIALLWGDRHRPARGPKPSLTLDQIVAAAIRVADAEGIDGLSMRRVAAELGVGTMSLYRYVPGKAELMALMLDEVCSPGDYPPVDSPGWRQVLELAARGAYRLYLKHPWLIYVNWSRPVLGPKGLAGVEFIVGGLAGLGLTDQERITVMITIDSFVTGAARSRIQYEAVVAETGLSDEEFWGQHYPVLAAAMTSGEYPAMAQLSEDAFDRSWEDTFEFGLARLLDGFAVLVEARRGSPPQAGTAQAGTAQAGPPQAGPPQAGPPQAGTAQAGTAAGSCQ